MADNNARTRPNPLTKDQRVIFERMANNYLFPELQKIRNYYVSIQDDPNIKMLDKNIKSTERFINDSIIPDEVDPLAHVFTPFLGSKLKPIHNYYFYSVGQHPAQNPGNKAESEQEVVPYKSGKLLFPKDPNFKHITDADVQRLRTKAEQLLPNSKQLISAIYDQHIPQENDFNSKFKRHEAEIHYFIARDFIDAYEKEKLAYEAELAAGQQTPTQSPQSVSTSAPVAPITIEPSIENPLTQPTKPKPIITSTPRDQWLSAIAQEVLKNRASENSNPIPAEVFFKVTVATEEEALERLHSELPKPESQTEDDYNKFLAAYSRIEPDGNNQFTLRIAELKADDDLIKHLTDGGFALDTDYNSFYRGYVLRHAFQQVGHAGAIEIDDALHGHIQHVDFDYGKKELQVKLISGEKNTESTVTITKDKFSASNSEDGAIMALVASAKAAGWPSYKITAEGDDLLSTAMAFIQNNLELDVSTQKKLLDTANSIRPDGQKFADYAAIKAWVKQPTSQPVQAAGTTPSSP